jgi:hypothetical protein
MDQDEGFGLAPVKMQGEQVEYDESFKTRVKRKLEKMGHNLERAKLRRVLFQSLQKKSHV